MTQFFCKENYSLKVNLAQKNKKTKFFRKENYSLKRNLAQK